MQKNRLLPTAEEKTVSYKQLRFVQPGSPVLKNVMVVVTDPKRDKRVTAPAKVSRDGRQAKPLRPKQKSGSLIRAPSSHFDELGDQVFGTLAGKSLTAVTYLTKSDKECLLSATQISNAFVWRRNLC